MKKSYRIRDLKKVLIPEKQFNCSARLICDCCKRKTTIVKFTMAPPDYIDTGPFCFHGHNINLCIWYEGKTVNNNWYRDSSFINLCPSCQDICKKELGIDKITCTESKKFLRI